MYKIPTVRYAICEPDKITFICPTLRDYIMYNIEEFIVHILIEAYNIDMDINGIIVYWALGVFIEYHGLIIGNNDIHDDVLERIAIASVIIVMKFCYEGRTMESYSSTALTAVVNGGKSILDNVIDTEMDILTKLDLIECFSKYCPLGYAIDNLTLVNVDDCKK
jgi:hypothetical protein